MSWQGPPQAHQPVTSRLSANAAPREGGSPPPGHPSNTKTSPGAGSDQYPHCGSFRGKRKALFESSLRSGRGPEGLAPFRAGVRGSSEDTAASPPGRSGSWCGGSPVSPPSLLCFPLSPPPGPREPASPPRHLEVPTSLCHQAPLGPQGGLPAPSSGAWSGPAQESPHPQEGPVSISSARSPPVMPLPRASFSLLTRLCEQKPFIVIKEHRRCSLEVCFFSHNLI